jgi:Flp pilus assembly protein TadG
MLIRIQCSDRRSGAVAVETALILSMTILILFGTFEYGRLLMDWNILNNAAREGCRYALVNNTSTTINSDVTSVVTSYMGPETGSFSGLTVTVSGTHNGVSTPVNNLVAGDLITVNVSGTYNFMNIVPLFPMPTNFVISSSPTMVCEGAT